MPTVMTRINPLAILAAAFVVSMLGWVWFTALFGKVYSSVLGREHNPAAKMPSLYFVGPMICMLLTVVTSAWLMPARGISSLASAISFGAVVGAGYLGTTAVNMGINPNIRRPLAYGFLSAGFFFVSSVLISATLYLLR
ncbi:DUF1761 domain-containing protein [Granulicella cerasi]|uniref:DUF1761 domain-containing protein n=1 Tax=Granulicella cerasi TaxID=741063 RepID=UPI0021DFC879|nr:DUF1761 domain-containing protein [Granulicella cerasi]